MNKPRRSRLSVVRRAQEDILFCKDAIQCNWYIGNLRLITAKYCIFIVRY